jgi:hypothetical protein
MLLKERKKENKNKQHKGNMASQPGPLTNWPWHGLGNFKVTRMLFI